MCRLINFFKKNNNANRAKYCKVAVALVSVILILTVAVSLTLSYVFTNTDSIENVFEPSFVRCEVDENFDGENKTDVKIKNSGDVDSYIRANVVMTWVSEDGTKVLPQKPVEGTDFEITYAGTDSNWVKGNDGIWYYTKSVPSAANAENVEDAFTEVLIKNCSLIEGREPNVGGTVYRLSVEILASAIQSSPDAAVGESWSNDKVTLAASDGTLTVTNIGG